MYGYICYRWCAANLLIKLNRQNFVSIYPIYITIVHAFRTGFPMNRKHEKKCKKKSWKKNCKEV